MSPSSSSSPDEKVQEQAQNESDTAAAATQNDDAPVSSSGEEVVSSAKENEQSKHEDNRVLHHAEKESGVSSSSVEATMNPALANDEAPSNAVSEVKGGAETKDEDAEELSTNKSSTRLDEEEKNEDENGEQAPEDEVEGDETNAEEATKEVDHENNDEDDNDDDEAEDDDDNDHSDSDSASGTNKKHKTTQESSSALPPRPVKRARTAYFIFTDEKRPKVQSEHAGEGVAVVARIMGQMWATLPVDEKESYQERAAQERERVAKELEEWKAAGGVLESENNGDGFQKDPAALIFPVARIRKICKLDPEVRGMSKEALLLITKCAELATSKLGKETVRVAQLQNRRKLLPEDVAHVCSHREQFLFLKDDVKDLLKDQVSNKQEDPKATKKGDTAREAAAVGSKPLTSYFGVAKK